MELVLLVGCALSIVLEVLSSVAVLFAVVALLGVILNAFERGR